MEMAIEADAPLTRAPPVDQVILTAMQSQAPRATAPTPWAQYDVSVVLGMVA